MENADKAKPVIWHVSSTSPTTSTVVSTGSMPSESTKTSFSPHSPTIERLERKTSSCSLCTILKAVAGTLFFFVMFILCLVLLSPVLIFLLVCWPCKSLFGSTYREIYVRALFWPSVLSSLFLYHSTLQNWWDQIDDEGFIYLGALPFSIFLQSLIHRERISAVITLNQPWELSLSCWGVLNARDLKRYSIEHLHVPLLDHFSSPDPQSIQRVVDFMNNLIIQKKRMYIHCKAGRGRSALMVACYYIWKYNMSPTEAVALLHKRRWHVNFGREQMASMQGYANYVKTSSSLIDPPAVSPSHEQGIELKTVTVSSGGVISQERLLSPTESSSKTVTLLSGEERASNGEEAPSQALHKRSTKTTCVTN